MAGRTVPACFFRQVLNPTQTFLAFGICSTVPNPLASGQEGRAKCHKLQCHFQYIVPIAIKRQH